MSGFKQLILKIEQHMKHHPHVVVGISGFGGSGKSHLAHKLRDYFQLNDKQLVRIDNLYGPNPNGPDIFDQSDWKLITHILKEVHAGGKLQYQGKGYKGTILQFDEELPKKDADYFSRYHPDQQANFIYEEYQ